MDKNVKLAYVNGTELKIGDIVSTFWGNVAIVKFKKHSNPCNFDFIDRIAVFADGHSMTIEKAMSYKVVNPNYPGYGFDF